MQGQRGVRTKNTEVAQREAQSEAQGWRTGCAGVAQGLRRGCAPLAQGVAQVGAGVAQVWRRCGAGVAQVWRRCEGWRRCGAGVTSSQQPTAIKTATTTTTATIPNKRPDRRQRNQAHGQTRRPGRGRWCSIASPPAPCVLCLAERRRLAVAGMSPRRNRPPPALRTPSVPFIKPHRATAGRRASFAALRNASVGDRDRLFGSSFSTSTGHRKRNPRAALRNARALPSGASLSARETAAEGAGRSQITESGQHYLTATVHRNHCGRNPKFMTKLRFLIWPAASHHHLAHTWRTPGAPLNDVSG